MQTLTSFSSSPYNMFSNSIPSISPTRFINNRRLQNTKFNLNGCDNLSQMLCISKQNRKSKLLLEKRESSLVAFGGKEPPGPNGEDHSALDAVLKLYEAIENRNLNQLSDVIGEECRCVCNFFSSFQSFHGKKQVMDFFSSLMRSLGNHIEFVVQPIFGDGMNVGISWKLEWKNTHFPLGKGFSFYICHIYHGKLFIKNVEMFIEPLVHVEPLRLKIMGIFTSAVDRMSPKAVFKVRQKKAAYILVGLLFMALLFFLRLSLD